MEIAESKAKISGTLSIGLLHYHFKLSGVQTVMANSLRSLILHGPYERLNIDLIASGASGPAGRAFAERITGWADRRGNRPVKVEISHVDLPCSAYDERPAESLEDFVGQAESTADKLLQYIKIRAASISPGEPPYILHVHNGNLGKNPPLTMAIKLLAQRCQEEDLPVCVLYQMHDFAEDNRPGCWSALRSCTGRSDSNFAVKMMYPTSRSVMWVVINSADRDRLIAAGMPQGRVTILPNAVDTESFTKPPAEPADDELRGHIAAFAEKKGQLFEKNRKILLSPIKVIRRKNVAESVLLLILSNLIESDRWQLIVTLTPNSPSDIEYCRRIEHFVKQNRLPVVIGFGSEIAPGADRIIEDGRVKKYSLVDLLAASEAVLTTSLQEGFGYVFHEPWLLAKALIGRDIPAVTVDFVAAGLQLGHLYSRLLIPAELIAERWGELLDLYAQKMGRLRRLAGAEPYGKAELRAMIEEKKTHNLCDSAGGDGGEMVDFADLTLEMQLLVIKKVIDDSSLAARITPVDSAARGLKDWLDTEIPDIISLNKQTVVRAYGLAGHAAALAGLIAEAGSRRAGDDSQSGLVEITNRPIFEGTLDIEHVRVLT